MNLSRISVPERHQRMVGIALLLGACSCLHVFVGCGGDGGDAQPQKKAPLVTVEPAAVGEIARTLDLTGEVVPIQAVQISATLEGPIAFCPWREGDVVKAGEVLIEIARPVYREEVRTAEAALAVAQAKLADLRAGARPEEIAQAAESVKQLEECAGFAKSDLDRVSQMVESGSLPGESAEKARVAYVKCQTDLAAARQKLQMLRAGPTATEIATQEAIVEEAAAKLELARARLSESTIPAPFGGTITKVYVRQGDMAAPRMPLIEMVDLSSLVVRCAVPEISTGAVRTGMEAQVRLDALPGRSFSARVVRVFPHLDPQLRTRTIELAVENDAPLAPGMFGRVLLILESVPDAVTVPVQAIIATPSGAQVAFVVADGKAAQRKVETGIEASGRIQILSGLNPGDQVVVSGQEKLKDGAEVRLSGPSEKGQSNTKPSEGGERPR